MKGSIVALIGSIVIILVLVFSQMEITFLAPNVSSQKTVTNTLLDENDSTANGKLKASQEALDKAETRIKELETELAVTQNSHRERLALLEERIGNIIPRVATNNQGSTHQTPTMISSSPPILMQQKNVVSLPPIPSPKQDKPSSVSSSSQSSQSFVSSIPKLEEYLIQNDAILKPGSSRDARTAHNKKVNELTKKHKELLLKEEVDETNRLAKLRGLDFTIRKKLLPQPYGDLKIPISSTDVYQAPRREGSLRDMYIDDWSQIAVCTIEKVASSELKKLLHRMNGDPNWRDEPWFKGGILKFKDQTDYKKIEKLMHNAVWTKMIFLRHPFERLVSCYKDKFGRGNKLYSVRMTGNRSTEMLSFETFVEMISAPNSEHQNQHWRPQHLFCGIKKYLKLFNFVGNFEKLEEHAQLFLKGTDLWHSYGSNGWGDFNSSMFARNEAAHRTSAGEVKGTLAIDQKKASMSYDELLPPGSKLRRKAFEYYRKDFEMMANINIPPFDNSRYKIDLATYGG
mmetsp:Transcript_40168/g.51752  ORF Transcript_40168/g.51752 Transcript_40168/m.51752 type:complete len:514 (-) Transcript_40168:279-1820(-)